MNKILILFILLTTSCSHQTKTLQTSKANNAFSNEGFIRWTQSDLQRFDSKNEVVKHQAQCHLQNSGSHDEMKVSMNDFSSQLSDNQEQAIYWNHIAACYIFHQNYAKAQFVIDFALNKKSNPHTRSVLLNNKGLVQLRQGRHEVALALFKEAIQNSPNALTPQFNLSLVYLEYGHVQSALPILQRLHSKHTNDEEIIAHLAFSYVLLQQYKQASVLFSKLSEPYKRRSDVTVVMAINELEQGNPEAARHLMLRQSRTNTDYLKRMSQVTEKRINQALENKRLAEERKQDQQKQARATASKNKPE